MLGATFRRFEDYPEVRFELFDYWGEFRFLDLVEGRDWVADACGVAFYEFAQTSH